MFTTPPIASAPYIAEVESETIDALHGAERNAVEIEGVDGQRTGRRIVRRPLMSTSVVSNPRPRRSAN